MKLQKLGGYSSVAIACLTLAMSGIIPVTLGGFKGLDFIDSVKMIAAYQASPIGFWMYYVFGMMISILTLIVILSLDERMRSDAPNLMHIAVIAGSAYTALTITTFIAGFFRNILLALTNDMSAFRAFLVIHEFMGTSAIHILGWGYLLIGCAAIKTRKLPRILGYIIVIFGIEGIIQFIFSVTQIDLGLIIYALVALVVYVWMGVVLLLKGDTKTE